MKTSWMMRLAVGIMALVLTLPVTGVAENACMTAQQVDADSYTQIYEAGLEETEGLSSFIDQSTEVYSVDSESIAEELTDTELFEGHCVESDVFDQAVVVSSQGQTDARAMMSHDDSTEDYVSIAEANSAGYGAWSEWSTTPVSASSTRKVETEKRYEQTGTSTVYHYNRFYYYNKGKGAWYASYADYWATVTMGYSGSWQYTSSNSRLPIDHYTDGLAVYYGENRDGNHWWYNESTTTEPVYGYVTYYRYADKVTDNNAAAHEKYKSILQNLSYQNDDIYYQFADLTGDGIDELMVEYHPYDNGSGRVFQIYTYKSGTASRILDEDEYGLNKITRYSKTNAIVLYLAGHGGESYDYYKFKNGKYSCVASKLREAKAGGGDRNGPWSYCNPKGECSKNTFTKKTKSLLKGKTQKWKVEKWKYWS